PATLMRNADLAMYRAKQAGKARVELYEPHLQGEMRPGAVGAAATAGPPRAALQDGEFALLHQPVVELTSGKVSAVAAQPRWRSSQGNLFTPADVLGADARAGVGGGQAAASDVSGWSLEEAVRAAAARHLAGFPAPVSVRLPARRLSDRSLSPSSMESLLHRHELPSGSLILELTGSDTRDGLDELELRLSALRRLGLSVALEGFGSGPLALSALRRLPVDILRLDRGLVDGVVESARLRKITAGLLRIADDLGLTSVAEGVDLPEQVVSLRELGCTHGQGAFFSGPLDEHRLRHTLAGGPYPVPETPLAGRPQARGRPNGMTGGMSGVSGMTPTTGGRAGGIGGAAGSVRTGEEQRRGSRTVVVAGVLPVRRQERREALPPWLATGGVLEGAEPGAHPPPPCSHAETAVPPT
ncbi:MAG: EAL domain-containing protein, partial [Streptomyces sp.]